MWLLLDRRNTYLKGSREHFCLLVLLTGRKPVDACTPSSVARSILVHHVILRIILRPSGSVHHGLHISIHFLVLLTKINCPGLVCLIGSALGVNI